MTIQVGDSLPSIKLQEGNPGNTVDIAALFKGKKGVLFAVPGAYTPGCSKTHLPGYIENADRFRAKGIDLVACVAVNDAFVMSAWGEAQGAGDKIRMLADPGADFTRAVGMQVEAKALGGTRSKRYSMLIEDGVVKSINLEPDGFGLTCSLAPALIDQL